MFKTKFVSSQIKAFIDDNIDSFVHEHLSPLTKSFLNCCSNIFKFFVSSQTYFVKLILIYLFFDLQKRTFNQSF